MRSGDPPPRRASPQQGLVPYSEDDADWFFGRGGWREIVVDNLRAYRVSVLYGASGVGKSSVLHAGVVRHLREQARRQYAASGAAELVAVPFSGWSSPDPAAALCDAVGEAVAAVDPALAADPPGGSLVECLAASAPGPAARCCSSSTNSRSTSSTTHARAVGRLRSGARGRAAGARHGGERASLHPRGRARAPRPVRGADPRAPGQPPADRPPRPRRRPRGDRAAAGALGGAHRRSLAVLRGHRSTALSPTFSPDGSLLATASEDGTARIWDASTRRPIAVLQHRDRVEDVAFSPDGKRLASAGDDETVRLWKVPSGRALAVLPGHAGSVVSVAFSPDGLLVASASLDGTAHVWDGRNGASVAVLRGHSAALSDARFSPDGTLVLTAILRGHTNAVRGAVVSPDGLLVASAGQDGTSRVWETRTGRPIAILRSNETVLEAAFSPDGREMATASDDGTARIWRARTGASVRVLRPGHGVAAVAFSPDGTRLATASGDDDAQVWHVRSGHRLLVLHGHTSPVERRREANPHVEHRRQRAGLGRGERPPRRHDPRSHEHRQQRQVQPGRTLVATTSVDHTARLHRCEVCGSLVVAAQARPRAARPRLRRWGSSAADAVGPSDSRIHSLDPDTVTAGAHALLDLLARMNLRAELPLIELQRVERAPDGDRNMVEPSNKTHVAAVPSAVWPRHHAATPSRCAAIAARAPTGSRATIRSSTCSC